MISQERRRGFGGVRSEFSHIPAAVEHFCPIVVGRSPPCPPMPRPSPRWPRDALMPPVNAAFGGEQGPDPWRVLLRRHPTTTDTHYEHNHRTSSRALHTSFTYTYTVYRLVRQQYLDVVNSWSGTVSISLYTTVTVQDGTRLTLIVSHARSHIQ